MKSGARMLTLAIVAVAAVLIAAVAGRMHFHDQAACEVASLLAETSAVGPEQLSARLPDLPAPVRRYLGFAIAPASPAISTVRLAHGGYFRPDTKGKWFAIRAIEYFSAATPGFVWRASVKAAPLVWIAARDRLANGRANMLIKLDWLITIADASGPEIDQAARLRWLAEAIWFPYAFVGDAVRWESIDACRARVSIATEDGCETATIGFDAEGRIETVQCLRYRETGTGAEAALTPWLGRCGDYREFSGFRVPTRVEVAWVIDGIETPYARFEVTGIEYNPGLQAPGTGWFRW